MGAGGAALRLLGTAFFFIEFAAAIAILGINSYFLAVMADQNVYIPQWVRAVEGLSGAGALYGIFGMVLTCFLGGVSFFAFLGIVLDILFIGAFIAVAVLTRGGDRNCNGLLDYTPLRFPAYIGNPNDNSVPSTYHACELLKAEFALAIIAACFFLFSVFVQFGIAAHHRREKRNAPLDNRATVAPTKKGPFWRRYGNNRINDPEYGNRASYESGMTGRTAVPANGVVTEKHATPATNY